MQHMEKQTTVSHVLAGPFVMVRRALVKKVNKQTEGIVISLLHCGVRPSLHPVKSLLPEMTHP